MQVRSNGEDAKLSMDGKTKLTDSRVDPPASLREEDPERVRDDGPASGLRDESQGAVWEVLEQQCGKHPILAKMIQVLLM